jgi:RNA polymerase sigma factor (sigma-70 family)
MRSGGREASEVAPPELAGRCDRGRGEDLVLALVGAHADSLLRVARRYSLCHDDAHDAYQRGLEILVRHAARLDPERAAGWLHTVVKHEALAINRSRRRMLGSAELDADALEARTSASPEERMLASDRVARSAEALHGLKPQEVRALWLKALGHSYEQICEVTGWTYTKVNRCLAEGRRSFLERYAGIESGAECRRLGPVLSAFVDGEADPAEALALRAHLRQCLGCRAAVRGLHDASRPLSVVLPATGLAAAAGGADHAGSFFMRVYETVTLHLHERAANSIMRAQAIVDAATAGKMAAVAASAAAVAGSGFAVEGAITSARDDRPGVVVRDLAATGAPAPSRPVASTVRARRARAHSATRSATRSARRHAPARKGHHAHRRAAPRATTPAPAPVPAPAPAAPVPAAPAVQQAAAPPPAQPPPSSPAPATTAAAASTSSGSSGTSSAASEFGFEGP